MIVIYELFKNENYMEDERNIGDFDTLKEAKYFFKTKLDTETSISNLSKTIKEKGIINKKYRIYKIKI